LVTTVLFELAVHGRILKDAKDIESLDGFHTAEMLPGFLRHTPLEVDSLDKLQVT
jgi:hypothetical protein